MPKAIDDLVALLPNARPGRVADTVFAFTVSTDEVEELAAAIDTLQVFGARSIAYYVYDTFEDVRIRVTFASGDAEPLIHYNKLRAALQSSNSVS